MKFERKETSEWNAYEIQARKIVYQIEAADESAVLAKTTRRTTHIRRWGSELSQLFNATHPLFEKPEDVKKFKREIRSVMAVLLASEVSRSPRLRNKTLKKLEELNFELVTQLQSKQYLFKFGTRPSKKELLRSYLPKNPKEEQDGI